MLGDDKNLISYAQNFEDVILWRALKYFPNGFYINVGAQGPTTGSVTKAFYDRGWRGVNVEPVQQHYDALCDERQHDVNLKTVVSDNEHDIKFYELPGTGLSTADTRLLEEYQQRGNEIIEHTMASTTLSSICESHAPENIHFLVIDVEGFEAEVLKGMDFKRWRPWVMVIESPFEQEPDWESSVLDAGYELVYYDGLNGFYLANEHANLKGAFKLPPCYMDNFQLCRGHEFSHPLDDSKESPEASAERKLQKINSSPIARLILKILKL